MLIISKPTRFSADGFASRGQCSLDSPGWQLRWLEPGKPLDVIWQGAFKTCRHLQAECGAVGDAEEAKNKVAELLKANSFARFTSMPTDIYPVPRDSDKPHADDEDDDRASNHSGKKKRKRKRNK